MVTIIAKNHIWGEGEIGVDELLGLTQDFIAAKSQL